MTSPGSEPVPGRAGPSRGARCGILSSASSATYRHPGPEPQWSRPPWRSAPHDAPPHSRTVRVPPRAGAARREHRLFRSLVGSTTASQRRGYGGGWGIRRVHRTVSTSKSASSSSPVPDRAPRRPGTPVVPAAGEVPAAEESRTPTRRRRKATAAATAPAQAPAAEQPVLAPPADHDADRAGGGAPARIRTSDDGGPDRTSDAAETSAVDGAEGDRSSEGSGASEGAEDTDDEGAAAAESCFKSPKLA